MKDDPKSPESSGFAAALGSVVLRRYVQSGDDQQADDCEPQTLEIESMDSGAGTFVRLTTARWAFCTEEEIEALARELRTALAVNVLPTCGAGD